MLRKKIKGSMTVEMAILFPIIFLTILGILYVCIIHYQNTVTATAAMRAASRGAVYWDKIGGDAAWDFQTNGDTNGGLMAWIDYTNHDPYRYFIDTKSNNKLNNIKSYTNWVQSANPAILEETQTNSPITVEKTGHIWQKYISVSVKKQYINPMQSYMESVGMSVSDKYVITARAPLNTPTEFIRNMSFFIDSMNGYGNKGD